VAMQEKKNLDGSLMKFINPPPVVRDSFINEDIPNFVDIELQNFDFFFDLADLGDTTRK
ncbi:unnamed protein product, partial [marine sediment metagenome]